jgi:hypothetical protein
MQKPADKWLVERRAVFAHRVRARRPPKVITGN